jgi:hypothetical protein
LLDLAQLLVVQSVLDSSAHAPRLYRLLNPLSNTGLENRMEEQSCLSRAL